MIIFIVGKKYKLTDSCKKVLLSLKYCDFVICEKILLPDGIPVFSYHGNVNLPNCCLTTEMSKNQSWVEEFKSKQPEEWL